MVWPFEQPQRSAATGPRAQARPTWSDPALLIIVVLAAAVRLPGCFSEFWLDEIWTQSFATQISSPAAIFTEGHHSNNHPLNTLVFYLIGNREHWVVYRIHSLVAGIGAVIACWLITRRDGRLEAIISSCLMAGSYLMIHFSSEARGYSLVIFFALATFFAAHRFVEDGRWHQAAAVWVCACLGFLSHLMYLQVFVAIGVWSFVHLLRSCVNKRDLVARCAQVYGLPILFLSCYYTFFIRHLEIGGGPRSWPIDVLTRALSYAGGGPAAGPGATVVSVFVVGCGWKTKSTDLKFIINALGRTLYRR